MGGLNDILCNILDSIVYCKHYNRTLLIAMKKTCYSIELSDYFDIENMGVRIIYESNQIKKHILNKTVYNNIDLNQILNENVSFVYNKPCRFSYNNIPCDLPNKVIKEDVILAVQCGGGKGFDMFKHFIWKESLKQLCLKKMSLKNYLCIQVRCTDYECDYKQLYEKNKNLIQSYPQIYLATDNKEVVHYFKSKGLNVFCFTTFPAKTFNSLHVSDVNPHTLFCDVIVDICMATNSSQILSNSKGGFIRLLKDCFANKSIILNKLNHS
jgi:hypothetical protein